MVIQKGLNLNLYKNIIHAYLRHYSEHKNNKKGKTPIGNL